MNWLSNINDDFLSDNQINLDLTYIINPVGGKTFLSRDEIDKLAPTVVEKHRMLQNGEGDCLDGDIPMLGWQTLPDEITSTHLDEVNQAATELRDKIDVFISMGIGGSYLGVEATIQALGHTYHNLVTANKKEPQIFFLGQNLDPDMFADTLKALEGQRIGINVISKSGTTTETAIAFRIIRSLLEQRLGDDASKMIVATTDKTRGALRTLTEQKGYQSFVVPDNIGGRFSILTDVGLFGLAVAGVDIYQFVDGFRHMKARTDTDDFWNNLSMVHAAVRHLSWQRGKRIEVVGTNSSALYPIARWMEQIFPESEGHNGYGMWVSPSMYSEKLHANGQMVQQGERNILETFLRLKEFNCNSVKIPVDAENLDGLNYLPDSGRDMNFVNQLVIEGPAYAHFMGGVPNMTINIPRRNAFNIGQLYFLMERSVAISGYLAGHNPFVQPGVEDYKRAMFALAGKPGFESAAEEINNSIAGMDRLVV